MNETFINTCDKKLRIHCKGVNEGIVFNECFSQEFTASSSILQEVKIQSSMQDPILRYLAIQSYHLFESVQNMNIFDLESVVMKSREFRAVLTECQDQFVTEISLMDNSNSNDEEKYNFATTYCNIIRDYQMLWYLAEIFFIKISSSGFLIQDLQGWLILQQPHVSYHYMQLKNKYIDSNGNIELESEDIYWPTVYNLAMQGRKMELLELLKYHSLTNGQAMRSVRQIVETLPLFSAEYVKCPLEFDLMWKNWRKLSENHLVNSCLLQPYSEFTLLVDILLGKKDVFFSRNVIDLVDGSWYYAVVPYLLYSSPLVTVQEISNCFKDFKRCFQKAVKQFDNVATEVCSEQILQAINAIFGLDLGDFIGSISRNNNDWWLPAHLVTVIEKISPHLFPPPLDSQGNGTDHEAGSLKEFFVIKYASALTSHNSMTLMALNYMDQCPTLGPRQIEHIISHLYLGTDRLTSMVHSWCVHRKYANIAASLCRRRAMAAYKDNDLGNSLAWSLRGGSDCSAFLSRIADRIIRAILSRDNRYRDLLDCVTGLSLGPCGKKMTFVVKFGEVLRLQEAGRHEDASRAVLALLDSQLVASQYSLAVLVAVRSLLAVPGLFRVGDVHGLMAVVEEASGNGFADPVELSDLRRELSVLLSHACLV